MQKRNEHHESENYKQSFVKNVSAFPITKREGPILNIYPAYDNISQPHFIIFARNMPKIMHTSIVKIINNIA